MEASNCHIYSQTPAKEADSCNVLVPGFVATFGAVSWVSLDCSM